MKDGFLIADCVVCERRALLTHDLLDGSLITRCIHCDEAIDASLADEATAAELAELGYVVPTEQSPHGGGGCRDGQCGVVQPDP